MIGEQHLFCQTNHEQLGPAPAVAVLRLYPVELRIQRAVSDNGTGQHFREKGQIEQALCQCDFPIDLFPCDICQK